MTNPELVVFGSLTIDNVVRANGEVMPQYFGGNALYAALGARIWSDSVGMVSLYGDGYPADFFDLMDRLGIATDGVHRVDRPHKMNVAFAYQPDGSRTRIIPQHLLDGMSEVDRQRFYDSSQRARGHTVLEDFGPQGDHMPAEWWPGVVGIHCASIPLVRLLDIAEATRAARGPALHLQTDAPWNDTPASRNADASALLPLIDLVMPSEQDLENYHPGVDRDEVALELMAEGVDALVLKKGPNGCRLYRRGRGIVADIPVVPVDAIDPTGAGDSFCGGFLAGYRRTGDMIAAAHYGAVAASFCVEARGLDGLIAADREHARQRLAALFVRSGLDHKIPELESK